MILQLQAKVHGLGNLGVLTCTYPNLSDFKATFRIIIFVNDEVCEARGVVVFCLGSSQVCSAVRWLAGWLVSWLVGWFVGWSVGWLVVWLVAWLVGRLIGWLVCWLVSWLADWLASWMASLLAQIA